MEIELLTEQVVPAACVTKVVAGPGDMRGLAELVFALRATVEVLRRSTDGSTCCGPARATSSCRSRTRPTERCCALEQPATVAALAQRTAVEPHVVEQKLMRARCRRRADVMAGGRRTARRRHGAALRPRAPALAEFGATPAELQRRLRDATVAIIGCGGLGTWALGGLACAGIGCFVLVDDDTVIDGLNRQVLYVDADIGRPKVECASEWVSRFAPRTMVTARTRPRRRGRRPACARRRHRGPARRHARTSWSGGSTRRASKPPRRTSRCGQSTPIVKVGPLYAPGRTACFACERRGYWRGTLTRSSRCARALRRPAVTLGPPAGVVGTLISLDVMRTLLGQPAATEGRAMLLNTQTLETT